MLISFTPPLLSTGRMPSSQPSARCRAPKIRGMEGPVISASSTAVALPPRRMRVASRLVTRLLPTPPLPLTTPMTFFTRLPGLAGASRLSGLREAQFSPQAEQS